MNEEQRKKLLVGGLAVVVLFFLLRSKVDGWLRDPIRKLQREVAAAEQSHESLAAEEIQLDAAKENLERWKEISLPPDIDNAQRLYREWVQSLAEECGFGRISVVPGSKSTQKEFSSISVEIRNAETDLQGLTRFLYLFDQADMLQRISSLKVNSPSAKGNPRLEVTLTAEGISATGADDRLELLARTPLTTAVKTTDEEIAAASSELFPIAENPEEFEPFLVRIDREMLRVKSVTESGWQVVRGAEGTTAAIHETNSVIELFPVAWDRKAISQEHYADFIKASPFLIPAPPRKFSPRITGVSSKTIKPGEEVTFTAKADGLDPELGDATFALADAAEGMTIDPASGEFQWKPVPDLKPGDYTATVLMTQEKNVDVKLDSKLKITIKKSNTAPTITVQKTAIVVLGKAFTTTANASDDDAGDTLKFSLGSGSPEGLTIDSETGQMKWTPPTTFTPGKYEVEVKVTDSSDEPKSASSKIELDVQDDHAALTFLTGSVGKDGVLYAWFRNKATDKRSELKLGDKLTVSEISVEIESITDRFVLLKDAEGLWKLNLGHGLRDRELIEPAAKPEPALNPETPAIPATPESTETPDPTETPSPAAPEVDVPVDDGAAVRSDGVESGNAIGEPGT